MKVRQNWTAEERRKYGLTQLEARKLEKTIPSKTANTSDGAPGKASPAKVGEVKPEPAASKLPAVSKGRASDKTTTESVLVGGKEKDLGKIRVKALASKSERKSAIGDNAANELSLTELGEDAAADAGVETLVAVEPAEKAAASTPKGKVKFEVDYAELAEDSTGDLASRLRLVRLPSCAVQTPEKKECRTQTPVTDTSNDLGAKTLTGTLEVQSTSDAGDTAPAAEPMVFGVAAAASGSAGSFAATPLSPAASWQVSEQSGSFAWSYPFRMPPSPGGLEPDLSLGYGSGSLDGKVASTNNQTSEVGDGWNLSASGYVERKYVACASDTAAVDGKTPNNATHKTGDMCWRSDNATLVLGGSSSDLIKDATTGEWHAETDDNTKIEKLSGGWNQDNDKEYWKVTTDDGTQYFFGRDKRAADDPVNTYSSWTQPVYGNHPGEPCYQSAANGGFGASRCRQTWRWNLDYVIDVHGNTMTYVYGRESDNYGYNMGQGVAGYQRGGYLARIDYGTRTGTLTDKAPYRVSFTMAERCVQAASECEPGDLTDATKSNWPDVPFDQICTSSTDCKTKYSAAFFTRKRLTAVTAQYLKSDGSYQSVDQWKLSHTFPNPGDDTDPALWLSKIQHLGLVGSQITLPATTFRGTQMANRVDTSSDNRPMMNRYRLTSITAEAGAVTSIDYSAPQCSATNKPANPWSNTMRCLPVRWIPQGEPDPVLEYFHKYVVKAVTDDPNDSATSLSQQIHYTYEGDPAFRYNDDELTAPKERTWSTWRGYGSVKVATGAPNNPDEPQNITRTTYFRGLNGGRLNDSGGTVSASVDGVIDRKQFAGQVRTDITYNGSSEVDRTTATPWRSAATATDADGDKAFHVGTSTTETRVVAPDLAGGNRTVRTETEHNSLGLAVKINDLGDVSTSADDQCTVNTYANNTTKNIIGMTSRVEMVAKACGATVSRPADVISDVRTAFDGGSFGDAPTRGLITRSQDLKAYDGTTPQYLTTETTTYDSYGRVTSVKDALGRQTTTAYTDANGQNVGVKTTGQDPDGDPAAGVSASVTTTVVHPAWGSVTKVTDGNGKVGSGTFDALGRATQVWQPGRVQGTDTPNVKYAYTIGGDGISAVTTQTLNHDGSKYLTSTSIYDGLLRERQSQSPSAEETSAGRVVTDMIYDSRGLVWRANSPWFTTGNPSTSLVVPAAAVPGRTVTRYDGAGRPTAEIFQVNEEEVWRTTTSYRGDRVSVNPPEGATPTTTIDDARGQTIELRQHTGATTASAYQTTKYDYDEAGQLTKMNDPDNNQWTYTYDLLGRQTEVNDPDKGTTHVTYDDAGQVLTTTDARGEKLAFTYDLLGRKTTVRDDSATGAVRASWDYDKLADGTVVKGATVRSTRHDGLSDFSVEATGYDASYRPTGQRVTIPSSMGAVAGTYDYAYTYTVDGRVKTMSLPKVGNLSAERVTTHYDDANQAGWMAGLFPNGTYVANSVYSQFGELLQADLGGNYVVQANYQYAVGTRRLEKSWVTREGADGYDYDAAYSYDDAGNVRAIANRPTATGVAGDVQCFDYDGLRRLAEAWTPESGDCAAAPSVAGLGGAAEYWTSYRFDKVGNRTSLTQHGSTDAVSTYAYPAAGGAKAHAVSSVETTTGGTSVTNTYDYDAAGNMTTRAVAGEPAQSLAWDAEGELASVTEDGGDASTYTYTADGDRLVRKQDGKTTVYLPGGQEVTVDDETSVVTAQRYYTFNGETVAVRTAAGASGTTTIVADHHGTGQVQVAQATNTVHRRYMDPYGGQRGAVPTWTGDHGFLDKPADATGLVQVGARYYDPGLGKFISPDPIMDVTDPQQWAAYSYANSNPVTWSDPSGMWLGGLVSKAKKAASKVVSAVKRHTKPVVAVVKSVSRAIWSVVKTTPVGRAISYVAKGVSSSPTVQRVVSGVRSFARDPGGTLQRAGSSAKAWGKQKARDAWAAAKRHAEHVERLAKAAAKADQRARDAVTAGIKSAGQSIANAASDAGQWLVDNRGTIATVAAVAGCLVPGVGLAACAVLGVAMAGISAQASVQSATGQSVGETLRNKETYKRWAVGSAFAVSGAGVGHAIKGGYAAARVAPRPFAGLQGRPGHASEFAMSTQVGVAVAGADMSAQAMVFR
ncbi:RHS repeat-associated core domain-containing protein [Nocardioides sp. NPDC047086]|uniref:RHS repeat domain-containing protein n=1 Tax=Nocardioides sp. NPDC047086 TaxID=3154810 RepID=UPI0034111865